MYWPLGAPKIFTAGDENADGTYYGDNDEADPKDPAHTYIRSLAISRGGQLVAVTTASTLSIWHTSVRGSLHLACLL